MWDRINEIMDNFNFAKIEKVMKSLDWGWAGLTNDMDDLETDSTDCFIPKERQLRKAARNIMADMIKHMPDEATHWSSSTGGFKAEITIEDYSEDGDGEVPPDDFEHRVSLTLSFIVDEWDSYWDY